MAGPDPDFDSAFSQLALAIKPIDQIYKFCNANSPNYLAMLDALQVAQDGVYTGSYAAQVNALLAGNLSACLSPAAVRAAFTPALLELADIIDSDSTDPNTILADLRQYMVDNSLSINSPNPTWDTPAADSNSHGGSGNTGVGTINRLSVDKDGEDLPTTAEQKYCEVTRDQNSGAREWEEQLRFWGAPRRNYPLEFTGSGPLQSGVSFVHGGANSTGFWLANPSFDLGTHADDTDLASTTAVTGWTATTAANWESQASHVYRGYPGAPTTQYGLECTASDAITQVLQSTRPTADYSAAPMYAQVAYKRLASATGNLTLALGSQSSTATIGSATNGQWNILRLAIGTRNWYENFNQDALALTITVDTLATGTVVIDDVILAPFVNIDGTWYCPVGGQGGNASVGTPPAVGDRWEWTDSTADAAILAFWLQWGFGANGWLPAVTGGTETQADPS